MSGCGDELDSGFFKYGVLCVVDPVVTNEKSGVGARDVFWDCNAGESVVLVKFI